eukprot:3677206-Pleurochrysis_carterae.AAC.1
MRQQALRELKEEQSLALAAAAGEVSAGETAATKREMAREVADAPAKSFCSFFAKSNLQSA